MRWGLVGTGTWAKAVHAPCLAAHPGVDFRGILGARFRAHAGPRGRIWRPRLRFVQRTPGFRRWRTERRGHLAPGVHIGCHRLFEQQIHTTLSADPADRAEWISFSGAKPKTTSPPGPLETLRAFHAAIDSVLHETDLARDPLLRHATLDAAIATTSVMKCLVSRIEIIQSGKGQAQ